MQAEQLKQQTHEIDLRTREYSNAQTWCAEVLNGSMRTNFDFYWNGYDLIGEDGGSMTAIFDDAIKDAKDIERKKPNLAFELRRRLIERGELDDMAAMMQDEQQNTMVVVSDFPPELMTATSDVGGYNVTRRQTMLRVITKQPNGSLRVTTQSLDGSNRQALEAIYGILGEAPAPGELLGQRLHLDLPPQWQEVLVDRLTDTYDASLQTQFGGSYHAGVKQVIGQNHIDTYQFTCQQHDLISWFSEAKLYDPIGAEKLRLGLAAAITARYEAYKQGGSAPNSISPAYSVQFKSNLLQEINAATQRAIARGDSFSGCGDSIQAERYKSENLTADQAAQAGYGNRTNEATAYTFNLYTYCRDCPEPPKKEAKKQWCGPCRLCRTHDKAHGGKG